MVSLSKACMALHCMPHRFTSFNTDAWDYMEMRSLYDFVFSPVELKFNQSNVKQYFCDELGVAREVFDDVANGMPLHEVLALEAEGDNKWTTDEVIGIAERWNAQGHPDNIVAFAQGLTSEQAPIVWRWMLKHNWAMYRNRLRHFLRLQSNSSTDTPADIALGKMYEVRDMPSFTPLQTWKQGAPEKMWRVSDAKALYYYDTVFVRRRNGEVDERLTSVVVNSSQVRDERAWLWTDGDTTRSTQEEGEAVTFAECITWLDHVQWDRPAVLIESDSQYYLYTRGTRRLRVALTGADTFMVDKQVRYKFDFSVMDGDELTPVDHIKMEAMTPELQRRVKGMGLILQRRSGYEDITQPIICDAVYAWSPEDDWSFRFASVASDAGLSDVDDFIDYAMLTEEMV